MQNRSYWQEPSNSNIYINRSGADKAPGEETSTSTEPVTQETQKGKKVDADPSKESDQPIDQNSL
jgi:hypothetical protein